MKMSLQLSCGTPEQFSGSLSGKRACIRDISSRLVYDLIFFVCLSVLCQRKQDLRQAIVVVVFLCGNGSDGFHFIGAVYHGDTVAYGS